MSKKESQRNECQRKLNMLEMSSDSSDNLETDLYFRPNVNNLDNYKLSKNNNKISKEIIIKSARNPLLHSLKHHIPNEEENSDIISKLKKENLELLQIISSKDKEILNLKAINNQIIKGQESKNEV